MALSDWLADTVRAAIIRELGSLPEEPEPAAPPPEASEPTPAAPVIAIESAKPGPTPAPGPEQEPAPGPEKIPSVADYRARRLSLEAQRLVASGLSGWLASRIEGLPAGAAPVQPARPPRAPTLPFPLMPQLDLFPAARAPVPPSAAPARGGPPQEPPAEGILPLSLPSGPVIILPLADLRPARIRARQSSDVDPAITALVSEVAAHGVREPILVRRRPEDVGRYEVVAGERRRLAAERAGLPDLPAVVVEADDTECLVLSLAENLGRGDFSPLDESRSYLRLLTEYRVSPAELARRLARERSHIALALRLLGLPPKVRQAIDGGRLAPAQVYSLLGAPDPEALAEQMIQGALPPRRPGAAR